MFTDCRSGAVDPVGQRGDVRSASAWRQAQRPPDPFASSLRYHLGLVTPNSEACRIFVDGESYSWRDGEAVMFDETFIHRAENKTDVTRVILFCDIERPLSSRIMTRLNRGFRSKLAHYTLKWLIIGGLLYWIFA
jgi:aspartyl/asparaginyl beta-hydroxylase